MDEDSQFQDILKVTLDMLGYSMKAIEKRRALTKRLSMELSKQHEPGITVHYAGSKAEGTTLPLENDDDFMYVLNDVVCVERVGGSEDLRSSVIFELVFDKDSPGYTTLVLRKLEKYHLVIMKPLFEDGEGNTYISSDFFADNIHKLLNQEDNTRNAYLSRSGPSCPLLNQCVEHNTVFDRVFCFRCECPTPLRKWSQRKRDGSWPTPAMIAHVNTLDAHAVPVGIKGHMLQFAQWRICFTLWEIFLLSTLTENVLQVYIILKNLAATVIKPVCPEITSYIVKNIILWMAETLPTDRIDIVPLLMKAILVLKLTVQAENLPCYMIPERNLLYNKLSQQQKLKLYALLSEMLEERGGMVLRCPRIGREMCFVYGHREQLDLRQLLNDLCEPDTQSTLETCEAVFPFQHNINEPWSLIEVLKVNKFTVVPYACEKIMKMPFNVLLKIPDIFSDVQISWSEIPPEITIGDVFSREDLLKLMNDNFHYISDLQKVALQICLSNEFS